jgi:hypothetical protein
MKKKLCKSAFQYPVAVCIAVSQAYCITYLWSSIQSEARWIRFGNSVGAGRDAVASSVHSCEQKYDFVVLWICAMFLADLPLTLLYVTLGSSLRK